jgi:hypothetical protein
MITIKEAAVRLGIAEEPTDNDLGKARAVLGYFGVEGVEGEKMGHLKAPKVYDPAKVEAVAALKNQV